MKKYFLYLIITLLSFVSQQLVAQVQEGYWINPVNSVPFSVVYVDSTLQPQGDSLIIEFSGETTFFADSGVVTWNFVSDTMYQALFGYNIQPPIQGISYETLLTTNVIFTGEWEQISWDTLITQEPWIADRSIKLSSADMGAIVAWDWYNMSVPSAKLVLDPTVPVIEGEDMDYAVDIPINGNLAFDIDDYKTNSEEIQAVFDYGVYTFNKPDFKLVYNDFVIWMIDTKPFYPDSFDMNTYHDWLYEYFNPIASTKITEILSTIHYENDISLIKVSECTYELTGELSNNTYRILNLQGKVILTGKLPDDNKVHLDEFSTGVYLLDIQLGDKNLVYKLVR